jgi:hypothetical protein
MSVRTVTLCVMDSELPSTLRYLAGNPIHVTVPHRRHVAAGEGISLHRSDRAMEALEQRSYPPRTRIEETVLDLTQTAKTFDDVCGWVTRAIARGLLPPRGGIR